MFDYYNDILPETEHAMSHERATISTFLTSRTLHLLLARYHSVLKQEDYKLLKADYKAYLRGLNSFLMTLLARSHASLAEFEGFIILLNRLFTISQYNSATLSLNFKQTLLALLAKYLSGERAVDWKKISGYTEDQIRLLVGHVDYLFNLEGKDDIDHISNNEVQKLNSVMRSLVYSHFEVVH